jgi:glycosyltransferase involved in cell wall biosynthesis
MMTLERQRAATVVIITPEFPPVRGGLAAYCAALAAALTDLSCEVTIVTAVAAGDRPAGTRVVEVAGWTRRHLGGIVALVADTEPATVVLQYVPQAFGRGGFNPALVHLARRLSGRTHLIGVVHELWRPWSWRPAALASALAQRLQLRLMLRSFGATVVTNPRYLAEVRRFAPSSRTLEIPVGPTVRIGAENGVPRHALRRDLGLAGCRVIGDLSVGGVGRRTEDLIAVMERQESDVHLLCIGALERDRPAMLRLASLANQRGLADRVHITGPVDEPDLARYIPVLDVCVHTEEHGASTRSTSLASMLAAGVPVVAYRGDETPSWLDETAGVISVRAHDTLALAAAVRALLGDMEARERLSVRALATAADRLAWSRIAASFMAAA